MNGRLADTAVIVARQAGTANAFVAVERGLRATRPDLGIKIFAYAEAGETFRDLGLPFTEVTCFSEAEPILNSLWRLRFLLTGTSLRPVDDGAWWSWARGAEVPSYAFVEQWVNYWQRFSTPGGESRFDLMPDYVAVVDELIKSRLIQLGCPADRLVVAGAPSLDLLGAAPASEVADLRRSWLGGDRGLVFLFVCEPTEPAFDAAAKLLLEALGKLSDELGLRLHLAFKPHPLQRDEGIEFPKSATDRVSTSLAPQGRLLLLNAADIIVGWGSMLLYEASVMGCPVISLRLNQEADLDLVRARPEIETVKRAEDLAPVLLRHSRQALEGTAPRRTERTKSESTRFVSALGLT